MHLVSFQSLIFIPVTTGMECTGIFLDKFSLFLLQQYCNKNTFITVTRLHFYNRNLGLILAEISLRMLESSLADFPVSFEEGWPDSQSLFQIVNLCEALVIPHTQGCHICSFPVINHLNFLYVTNGCKYCNCNKVFSYSRSNITTKQTTNILLPGS